MIPKLRFNGYTEDWANKTLGDIGEVRMCKRIFNSETSQSGDIPFFKIGTFGKTADAFIDRQLYETYREKYNFPSKGDILISASGTLGRRVRYNGEAAYYQDSNIVWIENNEELVTNQFLYFLYEIVRYESEGGTIQRLYNSIIKRAKIGVPSIAEQNKITLLLNSIDQKINLLTKKKDALETYKKGLMQKIFSQELRFKREDGTDYPEWETLRIEDISEERSERGFEDYPLLSITLHNGIVPQELGGKSDSSSSNKSNYKLVKVGDIGYNSMRMWQGASGVSSFEGIVSPAYTVFKLNERADAKFVGFLFKTHRLIGTFKSHSQGLTSDTWNLKYPTLKRIKIMLPSIDEQLKVVGILSQFDVNIESLSKRIEAAEQLKKGLLQQMFV
jgi:type I restriction enzyme S subunit